MNTKTWRTSCALLALLSAAPFASVHAAGFTPANGYQATAIDTGVASDRSIASFDVAGATLYGWQSDPNLNSGGNGFIGDLNGNNVALGSDGSRPDSYLASAFNSFTVYDAGSNALWLGFGVGDNTDDRIYSVNLSTNAWNLEGTLSQNFDAAIVGSNVFISGAGGDFNNEIWLLDTSGNDNHIIVADTGGFSAGLAADSSGNLYYGTATFASDVLARFDAAAISGVINDGDPVLTIGPDNTLSTLPGGGADVAVDSDGEVIFNFNGAESVVAAWDGVTGAAENFDELGDAQGDGFTFLTGLAADGSLASGGTLYALENSVSAIYAITAIPEPATGSLLLLGLGALALRRHRRT